MRQLLFTGEDMNKRNYQKELRAENAGRPDDAFGRRRISCFQLFPYGSLGRRRDDFCDGCRVLRKDVTMTKKRITKESHG